MGTIAERTLLATPRGGGNQSTLLIGLWPIERDLELENFNCSVSISGPVAERHRIAGADSIDALRLALQFVDNRLEHLGNEYILHWDDGSPYPA